MSVTVGEYLEDIIEQCGGFGKFQYILVPILFFSLANVNWTMMMMSFAGAEPGWWCEDYQGNDTSESFQACHINSTECSHFRYDDSMNTMLSEVRTICKCPSIRSFYEIWYGTYVETKTITKQLHTCRKGVMSYIELSESSKKVYCLILIYII